MQQLLNPWHHTTSPETKLRGCISSLCSRIRHGQQIYSTIYFDYFSDIISSDSWLEFPKTLVKISKKSWGESWTCAAWSRWSWYHHTQKRLSYRLITSCQDNFERHNLRFKHIYNHHLQKIKETVLKTSRVTDSPQSS